MNRQGFEMMNHPLNTTLEKLRRTAEWVKIRSEIPTGENWYSLQELTKPETFATLVERYQNYEPYLSERQTVLSLCASFSWWITAAVLGPLLLDERLPDLTTQFCVHAHDDGYCDAVALLPSLFTTLESNIAATHADATVVEAEKLQQSFLDQLYALLVPLHETAQQHAALTDKALWLPVADACVSIMVWLRQLQGLPKLQIEREVEQLLSSLPLRGKTGLLEVTYQNRGELFLRRSVCCYAYLSPEGEKCSTCPKLPLETRVEKLRSYMAKKVQQEVIEVAA